MKKISIVFCLLYAALAHSQSDTIVIHDFTKVMIETNKANNIIPITSLGSVNQAGFFLNEQPNGYVRFCNDEVSSIWVNGRLVASFSGCEIYNPIDWFSEGQTDTLFVSIYAESGLANLECELIVFESLQIIKDDPKSPRMIRDIYAEFSLICSIVLIFLIGFYVINNQTRVNYLFQKSFSLKISSYEFVNTGFLSSSSIQLIILFSLLASFLSIHLDQLLGLGYFTIDTSLTQVALTWLSLSLATFSFFLLKWVLVNAISRLFKFRGIPNFQLFDFLNFSTLFCVLIFSISIVDYVANPRNITWLKEGFIMTLPIALLTFIFWFSIKFLNNTTRKKLLIFSYLCATEIIPAIIIFGWFFK